MSKTWYPILNYEKCVACGACFAKCTHEVYLKEGDKVVVVYPEGCIQGCHGCQSLCPVEAIEYAGDSGGDNACCKDNCSGNDQCKC